MWSRCALKDKQPGLNVRFSLPNLSNNQSLVSSRPKSRGVNLLEDEIGCNLGDDISWIPSATRSSMRYLSSRHREVNLWQVQFSEIMGQLEREITALEQLEGIVDGFLQERQLYSQLMSDCITVTDCLSSGVPSHHPIFTELRKEERLTNSNREALQAQVCVLLSKISSLKKLRRQLEEDFHAKGEAAKLTMKCITLELNVGSSCLSVGQYRPHHVSYNTWLSRCKDLKMMANSLLKDSSTFRGNLRFTLANIKNTHEWQRRRTDDTLRKKIHELTRKKNMLLLERRQIKDEISHQTTEIQKLVCQIRACDNKQQQAFQRLDILNQRPGFELCRDLPHMSLTLENYDLVKIGAGLHSVLKLSHQELELKHKLLMVVEDKLARNAHILEVEKKCQSLRQTFLPARDTVVVLGNKERLHRTTGSSSCHEYLDREH